MTLRAWPLLAFLVALGAPRTGLAVEPVPAPSAQPAAEPAPAPPPVAPVALPAAPVASPAAPVALPAAPVASPLRPTSAALAVTLEILSPVGGAGVFYRRRPVEGALVVAGSLVAGGLLIYAARNGDRDATIVGAVAYTAVRGAGIAAAAPASPPDPAPHGGAPPPVATRPLGLAYGLSF